MFSSYGWKSNLFANIDIYVQPAYYCCGDCLVLENNCCCQTEATQHICFNFIETKILLV